MTKRLRSPIHYAGGKGNMVAKLLKFIPPHHTYVEVFGGGASLLFAKEPSPIEVYNDIDQDLVNLFRVLQDEEMFKKFHFKVSLTPYARAEFYHCKNTYKDETDPVERARKFFVAVRQSVSGNIKSGWSYTITASCRGMAKTISKWLSAIDLLPEIHQRLAVVQIDCRDFRDVLRAYDREDTFFYLDPPYVPSARKTKKLYRHEMTEKDHEELVDMLLNLKGKWLLSGYANPIYEKLEKHGIRRVDFETVCHLTVKSHWNGMCGEGGAKAKVPRVESLWFNYKLGG